jgi:hypothetical protein
VKRPLVLTLVMSLAATLLFVASGSAQTTINIVRASPLQVTNTTTPRRDRFLPYTFTTRGRMIPPGRYCSPGVNPGPGAANCIPIFCPPGVTDLTYCFLPGRGLICTGVVTVRVQHRGTTISSRNVGLRRDCTYISRVTFRTRLRTRIGTLSFRARFQGNVVLAPRNSATRLARAG